MYLYKTNLKRVLALALSLGLLTACGGGSSGSEPVFAAPISDSPQDYKLAELDFMDEQLRDTHPDLFFSQSETNYTLDLAELRDASEAMSNTEFRLEMAKFVADIGDQHTYITMPTDQMKKFPVKIWWVEERAIVIEADRAHQHLLGQEMLSIDGTPTSFIKDPAMEHLAYQNEYWKDALSPEYIYLAAVLENEGITSSVDMASFVFRDVAGAETFIDIESRVSINDWVRIEYTHETPPLYSIYDRNYAYEVKDGLLYIQYNSAFDMVGYPLSSFINEVEALMANADIEKVVVDIRFNWGGRIDHFVPAIQSLANSSFNTSGTLFVLTGRNSFSSAIGAIYSFQALTEATFVGGPTGGKPNGFSNVIGYSLPGSGNALFMSTAFLQDTDMEVDSFNPDYQALFTQQDFLTGQDPAINFVLNF